MFYLIVPVCCSLNMLLGTRVFLLTLNRFFPENLSFPSPFEIMLLQIFKRVPKSVKIVFQINYIFEKHFHIVVISISKRLIIISQVKHLYFRSGLFNDFSNMWKTKLTSVILRKTSEKMVLHKIIRCVQYSITTYNC